MNGLNATIYHSDFVIIEFSYVLFNASDLTQFFSYLFHPTEKLVSFDHANAESYN